MKTVIIPSRPKETETQVDLELVRDRPMFIKDKSNDKIIGMISSFYTNLNENNMATDSSKCLWHASTGFGGLYGSHNSLKDLLNQIDFRKYELVIF